MDINEVFNWLITGWRAWIILGAVAGFIANIIMAEQDRGFIYYTVLGIVGAFLGGFIFQFFGERAATGLNPYSILVSTVGAVVILFVANLIRKAK